MVNTIPCLIYIETVYYWHCHLFSSEWTLVIPWWLLNWEILWFSWWCHDLREPRWQRGLCSHPWPDSYRRLDYAVQGKICLQYNYSKPHFVPGLSDFSGRRMMYRPTQEPFPAGKSVVIRPSSFFSLTLCWSALIPQAVLRGDTFFFSSTAVHGHHVIRILHVYHVPVLLQVLVREKQLHSYLLCSCVVMHSHQTCTQTGLPTPLYLN